jgi:hypothetical protein
LPSDSLSGNVAGTVLILLVLAASVWLAVSSARTAGGRFLFVTAVALRAALSALSAFGVMFLADSDRLDFHNAAASLAQGAMSSADVSDGSLFYVRVLSGLYAVFGPSMLLGSVVALLAFALSMHFLLKTSRLFGGNAESLLILAFGFSPAMLYFANYTYREPLQILFVILSVYNALMLRRTGSVWRLCAMTVCLGIFSLLHSAFFLISPVIFVATLFFKRSDGRRRSPSARFAEILATLFIAAVSGVAFFNSFSNIRVIQVAMEGNVVNTIYNAKYLMIQLGARTVLPVQLESSSLAELIWKSPLMVIQFMFAPIIPWIVGAAQDLLAVLDTALRSAFLFAAIRQVRMTRDARRSEMLFLLIIYAAFVLLGAMGTTTVGTAMRHQIKASWILVLLGAPFLGRLFQTSSRIGLTGPSGSVLLHRPRKI